MFKTNPLSLSQLLNAADNGTLRLPDFQRGWIWDDDRIKGLLASISRGFPIGAIMTLQAGGQIRLRSRLIQGVEGTPRNKANSYLLDGQQRLTSLYQALLHKGPVNTRSNRGQRIQRWYYIDMREAMNPNADREDAVVSVPATKIETRNFGRDIALDLSTQELEFAQHMIPTEQLLDNSTNWLLGYIGYWQGSDVEHPRGNAIDFYNEFNESVITAFTSYQLPVIELTKETPKEAVCTVFEKVNTGGVALSVFELATAIFAGEDECFSLRDDWAARRERMHGGYSVLRGIEGEQYLQAVALLATHNKRKEAVISGKPQNQLPAISCKRNDILSLDVRDYQRWADDLEAAFGRVAKFLHRQFVFNQRDVPYTTQIVPLAAIYADLGSELETANAQRLLQRWFWSGIFGEIYGGTVETQYARDLEQVTEWVRGGGAPIMINEANFIPERLLSLRTRNSAAYKGLYALQMKSGAKDWRTDNPLVFDSWDQENIDIHHIFPKRWCEKDANPPIPPRLYNSVINKTPIDAKTNKMIGGNAPSKYLPRLEREAISPDTLDQVLRSHWLTPDLLYSDKFPDCFIARGEEMLKLIGEVMEKPIPDGREVFLSALQDAGYADDFDDEVDVIEYDLIGERAYDNEADIAAD